MNETPEEKAVSKGRSMWIIASLVVIIIVGVAYTFLSNRGDEIPQSVKPVVSGQPEQQAQGQQSQGVYTLADVAKHSDRSSCWTVIRGDVYDVTKAIDTHPGGPDKILSLCGKDGTSGFVAQHGGKQKPEAGLERAKIGSLAK